MSWKAGAMKCSSIPRSGARHLFFSFVCWHRPGMRPAMSTLNNPFAPFDAALASAFEENIRAALAEDIGSGDVTGKLVPENESVKARVIKHKQTKKNNTPKNKNNKTQKKPRIRITWRFAEGALME